MARPTPPFDPTPEEEGYEASRSYLKKRFATWGAEQRVELGTDAGEAPIHYKYHYVDGHLTRWSCADLDQVYLELHPAKVIVEVDELEAVLDEAKAFLAFLDDAGLLDPESDDPRVLADHIDAIAPRFRTNMADVSRFSPGKRLWSAAISEGVKLDDEAAVQSFMASFNARSRAERELVFGHSLPATSSRTPSGRPRRQAPAPVRSRRAVGASEAERAAGGLA
jgi:hypothetical protein